jgi:hypothetical protein
VPGNVAEFCFYNIVRQISSKLPKITVAPCTVRS